MVYDGAIPFDNDGNQVCFPQNWEEYEWKKNYTFYATLKILNIESGRSAKHLIVEDHEGHTYTMFVADLVKSVNAGSVSGSLLFGKWTFCKTGNIHGGMNYGLAPTDFSAKDCGCDKPHKPGLGQCCCNCKHLLPDFSHPWTDGQSISHQRGWICHMPFEAVDKVEAYSGWGLHGMCESWDGERDTDVEEIPRPGEND